MQSTGPDSAYSWIVAGSSFFLYMMMYGAYRLSGIMFVASMPRFGVGREAASFPYTFAGFTKNVAGPLVGIMLNKLRIRTLIICGCSLAALGIGTCFFAENIFVVTVLWGVVYGFGFALSCSLLPVLINQHFIKHRATAAGIAFSGMCVGSMIFPPLVEICIDFYGISGTFLIIAGLVLNCVPLGIFLKERTINKDGEEKYTAPRHPKQKRVSFSITEKTPLLGSNGQLKKNVLLYSSITEGKPSSFSQNCCIEESGLESKNNEFAVGIGNVSGDNKLKKSEHISNDLDNEQMNNFNDGFVDSTTDTVVHLVTNINIEEALEYQESSKEQSISNDISLHKADNLYEKADIYDSTVCSDKGYFCTMEDDTHKITDDCINSSGNSTGQNSPEGTVTPSFPPQCKNSTETFQTTFNETKFVDLKKEYATEEVSFSPNANYLDYKPSVYDDLKDEIQDEICAVVPKKDKQMSASNTKDGNSICRGNCSLLLSFTYIVVLFTKTLSNSIALCVNTVIFDFSRDIGIAVENEKYVLISSSMGELLGRLCLGSITDSHCLSKPMFMVMCSLGQGLGALCIAWSTGFYVLSAGLFVYSFMGSVAQFMCPLVIADGIAEDKQAFAITSSSFLAGPASLVISPLIGYLRDEIGTYTYLFYGISIMCVLTGIMWLIGYFVIKPKILYTKIK